MSNGIGHVWAVNAEGGDEGRPNGVGPVWIENADQLGSKLPEPEAGDTGKVLGVLNSSGDIGWVVDQSGTFTQVQADWDETDSSKASFIDNKPSLATVATTGAYSDLSGTPTIPTVDQTYDASSTNAQSGTAVAGAISGVRQVPSTSSGDNGKVLGVTDSSGTLGWVAKGEADLFYVTYNVTTFDEIKAAHDAGKWPVIVDSSGHFVPMVDFDWIGTASSVSYARFQTSTYLFHADTDGAGYYNVVYYLRLEIDPDWNRTETWSTVGGATSADWDAVSGPRAIRNKPTIPTVDQTYNAASTNAQSGVAVAQAIAEIPSASYTAGDGIAISSSKAISAVGGDGITVTGPSTSSVNLYAPTRTNGTSVVMLTPLTADLVSMIETGGLTVVPSIDLTSTFDPIVGLYASICTIGNYNLIDQSQRLVLGQVNLSVTHTQVPDPEDPEFLEDYYTAASNGATLVYDIDDLHSTLSKTLTWADVKASPSNYAIVLLFFRNESSCIAGSYDTGSSSDAFNTGVYTTATPGAITVTNPLPASAVGDAGKVLKVDSNGDPEWESEPVILGLTAGSNVTITEANNAVTIAATDTTYTAGNMIAIDANNSNAIGVSTTAGITDIQQVAALPANPVSTVLYLIPET